MRPRDLQAVVGRGPGEEVLVLSLQQQLGQAVGQWGQLEGRAGERSDRVQGRRQGEGVGLRGGQRTSSPSSGLFGPGRAPGWGCQGFRRTGARGLAGVGQVLISAPTPAPAYQTFLAGGVGGIGTGVGESLPTDLTLEGFLSCVNPLVLLQVMFELEGLAAVTTFEFPQVRPVLVVGHVAHQLLQVGELLAAQSARLQG